MAAEQGNALAQNNLAAMCETGREVKQDPAEAIYWYRLAAEAGHALAQYNLGAAYENGLGVPQNYVEAMRWHRKAAYQNHAAAQFSIGLRYDTGGRGVEQDFVEAHKWFALSAARFAPAMAANIQRALNNCQLVAARLTPSQIAEAHRLASGWKPKAPIESR